MLFIAKIKKYLHAISITAIVERSDGHTDIRYTEKLIN